MRGLFTKIFLGFWIAQSLTLVISTMLILRGHFSWPDQVMDALGTTLRNEGTVAADIYEEAGCSGLLQYTAQLHQTMHLADSPAHLLCGVNPSPVYRELLVRAAGTRKIIAMQAGSQYVWGVAVYSASGRRYSMFLSRPYRVRDPNWLQNIERFSYPQLPVAIVVFGVTTFIMVLFLTRPIAKLRVAARDLANGKLATRIPKPASEERLFGGDEIQGLIHDFNYMAERLESLVGAQKLLVRDVSHELRSPLARLSVALELAREEAPAAMRKHLIRIEREAGRLNLLIGQLLRLSFLESTDAPIGSEEFSLNGLLDELLPDAEFEAQQRSCHVKVESLCLCIVRGNPELMYRAIENVVRNAIRYTREGSVVELHLRGEARAQEETAILTVSDCGPGLPESEIGNIFLPFYRLDDARQRDTGGFGVGLAIAERAVRLHRGEVHAKNRPEGGLTVTIVLPCRTAAIPVVHAHEPSAPVRGGG